MHHSCRRAIVMIHGFMGSPAQFNPLLDRLDPADGDLHVLTLPGHEKDLRAFAASGRTEWLEMTQTFVRTLQASYDELVLVGHSAGGLLAIQAAVQDPRKINGIVAIALPLAVRPTLFGLTVWIRTISRPRPDEPAAVTAARNFCGVRGVTLINSIRLLPNTIGLLRLIRQTRLILPQLTNRLMVITSINDEIVSGRSFRQLTRLRPQTTMIQLKTARHFWYPDDALNRITDAIRQFC